MTRFSRDYGAKLVKAQDDRRRAAMDKYAESLDAPVNFTFLDGMTDALVKAARPKLKSVPVFPRMCVAAGYPMPQCEFEFHPTRKWRFDYAWPDQKLALEVDGGIWRKGGGAHSHPQNIERDIQKSNAAALLGWRILRYAPEDLALAIIDLRGMFKD